MDSLLATYILNQGIILNQTNCYLSQEDINNIYDKKFQSIINSIIYSKGIFTETILRPVNRINRVNLLFNNNDIHSLSLMLDNSLDTPKLNKDYRIMYYVNEKNQIILLNYEPY